MIGILLFAANQPERLGTQLVDWIAIGVLALMVISYLVVSAHRARSTVRFSPLRKALRTFDRTYRG